MPGTRPLEELRRDHVEGSATSAGGRAKGARRAWWLFRCEILLHSFLGNILYHVLVDINLNVNSVQRPS